MSGDAETQSTDEDFDAFGEVVTVVEAVGPHQEGRIEYRGTSWQAACYDHTLEAGAKAQIVCRVNLIWIVEPANPLNAKYPW